MHYVDLPLREWTNQFFDDYFIPRFGAFFEALGRPIESLLTFIEWILSTVPAEVMALVLIALAWRVRGLGFAMFTFIGLLYIGSVDLWAEAMRTLSIVLVAAIFSLIIGIPLGIVAAKSETASRIVRPILDFMQTLPSFVYLIPTILLFGIGGVSATIATFVFATPPVVRLTDLGIRQVPRDLVEAAQAFGSTRWQMLYKVELPMARPSIMAGVNQTIMLALSMAVIAAMIGAEGLGKIVISGISRVDIGLGLTGGLGIVVLAIILDRLTESLGQERKSKMNV